MGGTSLVAFFLPDLRGGGAQRVVLNLVNHLGRQGGNVELVVAYRLGELVEEVDDSVSLVDLNTPHVPGIGAAACIPDLVRYLRTRDPDVVLSALRYANTIGAVAHELSGIDGAFVAAEHTTYGMETKPKDRLVGVLSRLSYRRVDRVVAVSEGVKRSILDGTALRDEDVTVIYNPVVSPALDDLSREPIEHEWFRDDDFQVVLGVGRLEAAKNFSSLVRAFARVARRRDEARLVILGDGSKRRELETLAADLGVDDRVSLPGFVDNPYKYMRNADVFALSSTREGLPTVVIEALACGCPVVATDCPHGPAEILDDGRYGTLVPMEDDGALAEAVTGALDRPEAAEPLRDRANDFSIGAIATEYGRLIERLG